MKHRRASLGAKLILTLTGVGVVAAVAITLLLAAVITPSFDELERRAVDGHVERTRAGLADFAAKVEGAVRDYGDWTASYDYMARPNLAFEEESFSALAMSNLDVQGMAYVAPDGRVVIARWLGRNGEDARARAELVRTIGRTDLARALAGRRSAGWYAPIGGEMAAVAAAVIRRSDGTGSPRGHVLMARVLTSAGMSELLQVRARIDRRPPAALTAPSRATMGIAVPLPGADGRAVGSARFSVPRDVSLLGRRMLMLAVAGSTLLLLAVLMVLRRAVDRIVLAPLSRVERHMQHVRASGSLAALDGGERGDEIGSLGVSFNAMLAQLKTLREQIEAQSFQLGRSESAVAVMHNVRNALNPVSTVLSQVVALGAPVDRTLVDRALGELACDEVEGARRRKLARFALAAVEADARADADRAHALQVGREAMAHVLEIIGQQQRQAHERPALEPCDVGELIARNVAIARYAAGVDVDVRFPAKGPRVLANRVILSQVIGNLLGNAAEAIAAAGRTAGTVSIAAEVVDGATEIRFADDGEGFDPGAGDALFRRGFSTRAHKSGGLGLHWCANSMTAMDGALRLESEGRGRGATAVLTLRTAEPALAAAA